VSETPTVDSAVRRARKSGGGSRRLSNGLRVGILWVFAVVVVLGPLYIALSTASKPTADARAVNALLPTHFDLFQNFATVISEGNEIQGFFNSLIAVVPSIAILLVFSSMCAWVFARGKHRAIHSLYYVAISGLLVPAAIVVTLRLLGALHLSGLTALILFYAGTQLSLGTFIMTGFIKSIPFEIEEAARIDGASTLRVYFSIILPSLRPVMLTAGIIFGLFLWNDFLTPFFFITDPSQNTMPLGLYNFASANTYEFNWNLVFAQVILVSLPLLVVYAVAQKRIVGGLLGGALK
jgi:raffinose/stachyose/melibiose transport system permease protein